jgi:hypothetical protein
LVIALLLVWMVGLLGATQGCQTVEVLHHADIDHGAANRIYVDTVLAFRKTVAPLAVGQLLLGSLLTLTAGLTLLGRGQARRLALQAILVYALFLPIDYVLRRPMREWVIDAIASDPTFPSFNGGESPPKLADLRYVWWASRAALGAQLAILTVGLFAMTRPRVRAFFGAMAAERARDEP